MAGDAPNSKRARTSLLAAVEMEDDLGAGIEVGVDAALVENNEISGGGVVGGSSSETSSFSDTDSDCNEAESNSDTDANAMVNSDDENYGELGPQSLEYSLLDGDSDIELDDVELFCEETIALLAHEILCCEGESDSESEFELESESESELESELESGSESELESESESESESETESESEGDNLDVGPMKEKKVLQKKEKVDGSMQYGSPNPYQLMVSEEDEDVAAKSNENEPQSPLDNSVTSQTSLLPDQGQDLNGEEKPEAKKENNFD